MRVLDDVDVDLNLLLPLAALLEERHVTRAAERAHMSQPAMSRALAGLRRTFDDELLVRGPAGYEPTPRAERIERDLRSLLPRVRQLFAGDVFEPIAATENHRLAGHRLRSVVVRAVAVPRRPRGVPAVADHVHAVARPRVRRPRARDGRPRLLRGRAAAGTAFGGAVREETFVCLVSATHPLATRRRIDLATYLDASHVVIDVGGGEQAVIDRHLATLGRRRVAGLRLPYHAAAPAALPGTALVATLPRRLVDTFAPDPRLRVLTAPREIATMTYRMSWHPRLDDDPAHRWLRAQVHAVVT